MFNRLHEQATSAHHGHTHALETAAYSSYPTMAGELHFLTIFWCEMDSELRFEMWPIICFDISDEKWSRF